MHSFIPPFAVFISEYYISLERSALRELSARILIPHRYQNADAMLV